MNILQRNEPPTSLVPIFISPSTGKYEGDQIRLGSRGDSYYEYLYKQYHQIINPGPKDIAMRDMWTRAWTGTKEYLVTCSPREGLLYIGEWDHGAPPSVMEKISKDGRDRGVKARQSELEKCENKPGLSVCDDGVN
jgi:hypothetical protein